MVYFKTIKIKSSSGKLFYKKFTYSVTFFSRLDYASFGIVSEIPSKLSISNTSSKTQVVNPHSHLSCCDHRRAADARTFLVFFPSYRIFFPLHCIGFHPCFTVSLSCGTVPHFPFLASVPNKIPHLHFYWHPLIEKINRMESNYPNITPDN